MKTIEGKVEVKRIPNKEEQHLLMRIYPGDKMVFENTAAAPEADTIEIVWPEGQRGTLVERTTHNRFYLRLPPELANAVTAIAKATGEDHNKVLEGLLRRGLEIDKRQGA